MCIYILLGLGVCCKNFYGWFGGENTRTTKVVIVRQTIVCQSPSFFNKGVNRFSDAEEYTNNCICHAFVRSVSTFRTTNKMRMNVQLQKWMALVWNVYFLNPSNFSEVENVSSLISYTESVSNYA